MNGALGRHRISSQGIGRERHVGICGRFIIVVGAMEEVLPSATLFANDGSLHFAVIP